VKWQKRDRGQDLVEFALIAPVLFLILFGIIEFGVAVWSYNTMAQAAREGARAGIVIKDAAERQNTATQVATDYVQGVGVGSVTENLTVAYSMSDLVITGTDGVSVTHPNAIVDISVSAKYRGVTGITRLVSADGITMSATSSMLMEGPAD